MSEEPDLYFCTLAQFINFTLRKRCTAEPTGQTPKWQTLGGTQTQLSIETWAHKQKKTSTHTHTHIS